jgi:outer membrane immunogenic protein
MQRQFLAGVALVAMTAGSAFAADLGMPVKAAAPAALYDWGGTYIGGVVGGAWGTNDISDPGLGVIGTALGVPVIQSTNPSAFVGGVEGGSRYQFAKLVVGWEADITWGNLNGTNTTSFTSPVIGGGIAPITRSITTDTKWVATATSTVGIAHNNWLLYGKAGVAYENVNYTDNWAGGGVALFSGTGSNSRTGWTVGTGVEWAFNQSWSVKAEYDYLDFGTKNIPLSGTLAGGTGFAPGIQDSNHINQFKAGLNYRFLSNLW